jgi:hypothetical protein
MRKRKLRLLTTSAFFCITAAAFGYVVTLAVPALSGRGYPKESITAQIAEVTRIEHQLFEETKRARNVVLNDVLREFMRRLGGQVTAESVRHLNTLQDSRTIFDDFLAAETTLTPGYARCEHIDFAIPRRCSLENYV